MIYPINTITDGGIIMGLFGPSRNEKILKEALKHANPQRKTVQCPRCGQRYTVTFLGSNDSKTCKCGYKIYCD